jgi:riboflavin kinase/FMN adenylyltransferase
MRVFHDLNELPVFQNAVLTIGSFDGVHSGHQKILEQINQLARSVNGESVVITFHPHPRQVIYPKDKSLRLITTIDEKVDLLEQYGVDNVVVVPFTVEFSQQSADEYIEKFLLEKFHPKFIVIGYDHRFGLNRRGDINYLRWYSKKAGFRLIEITKQMVDDMTISSTKIRNALEKGEVRKAARLLNHPFILTGTVVKGQQIGTTIGFPTANLEVSSPYKQIPPDGIYAVCVLHKGQRYQGMLYIGRRPSLKDLPQRMIEVNIFDFDKTIYGDKVRLEIIEHIREDASFPDMEQLSLQLQRDKETSLRILRQYSEQLQQREAEEKLPRVTVAILNFNTRELLRQYLPGVLQTDYPNLEVAVIDNGSEDGSAELIRTHFPQIQFIQLDRNFGFAGGYNKGLESLAADYFVLLNSDVEVESGWLRPLIEALEKNPKAGAAQPFILDYHQRDQFEYAGAAGGLIDFLGYPFSRGRIFSTVEKNEGQYDYQEPVFWASGAAFVIRAALFRQLGGFDSDYFAHLEEIDLCWRLQRSGYEILVVPESKVYHIGGGTLNYESPQKTYLNFRNSLVTLLKNEPGSKLIWLLPLRLLMDGLAGMLFLIQGKPSHVRAIIKAHWRFFPSFLQVLKKRKKYNELINRVSIHQAPELKGVYRKSIVWQYYVRGKKYYKNLK